ncbi:MAG: hypothetical protein AABY26_04065, partial [Nanoarchaeota archaeon]
MKIGIEKKEYIGYGYFPENGEYGNRKMEGHFLCMKRKVGENVRGEIVESKQEIGPLEDIVGYVVGPVLVAGVIV